MPRAAQLDTSAVAGNTYQPGSDVRVVGVGTRRREAPSLQWPQAGAGASAPDIGADHLGRIEPRLDPDDRAARRAALPHDAPILPMPARAVPPGVGEEVFAADSASVQPAPDPRPAMPMDIGAPGGGMVFEET